MTLTLAAYVACLPTHGTPDVGFWLNWIDLMRAHGVIGGYALAGSDYLPGAFVVLAAGNWAGDALGLGVLMALKLTIAAFALAGALIFWWWDRHAWHATAFLFALLINSVAHAYLDAFYLPSLLLTFWMLQRQRLSLVGLFLAGLFLGTALCFKWQPLLVAPFVFIYAYRLASRSRLAGALSIAIGLALPMALELAVFGVPPVAHSLARATSHHTLSNQGLNIYWVVQMAIHAAKGLTVPLFLTPLPRPLLRVTQVLFLLAYVTAIAALWRRGKTFEDFLSCTFVGTLAYFSLSAGVHENHLFVAMILAFCLLMTNTRHARIACAFVAVSANVNLILFYGFTGSGPFLDSVALNAITIAVSVINTAFFLWCFWCLLPLPRLRTDSRPHPE